MKAKVFLSLLSILLFNSKIVAQNFDFLTEIPMDSTHINEGFEPLKGKLDSVNVVLTGENHKFYAVNQYTKFKFMRFLHQYGFRYLTIEFGSGIGYLANDYVFNGNQKAADILVENFKGNQSAFVEVLGMLKRYNDSLPNQNDKIQIRGIDYTRYPFYSTRALASIIEKAECEDDLQEFYEDLNVISTGNAKIDRLGFATVGKAPNFDLRYSFKTYENRIFELSIRNLIRDFYRDTVNFAIALDSRFNSFKNIIDDLKETLDWYKGDGISIQSHTMRERKMAKSLIEIFENDTSAKIFGQFGRCHIRNEQYDQNCYAFKISSLAERIEKNKRHNIKALKIPVFYFENGDFKSNKKLTGIRTSELFKPAKLFIYQSLGEEILFSENLQINSDFILLNTFSSSAELEEIIEQEEVKYPSKIAYYSGDGGESFLSLESQLGIYENSLNDDFGVNLSSRNHLFSGFGLKSIDFNKFQIGYRFLMLLPNTVESDSSVFRYSHFRHDFNVGYNIIHNKIFSWYTDLNFILGFAKIREQTYGDENIFTHPVKSEKVNYRNFYYAGAISSGLRFKIGDLSINLEAAYLRDFSNPDWRVNGVPVNGVSRLNFSDFIYSVGLGIRL